MIDVNIDNSTIKYKATFLGVDYWLEAKLELISPNRAAHMLSNQPPNQRKVKKAHLERIVQAMESNEYFDGVLNPILLTKVDGEEIVADGQHRLYGVIKSNTAHWFFVIRYIPWEAFMYLDQNEKRTAQDTVRQRTPKNAQGIASAITLLYHLIQGQAANPRNEVVDRVYQDYPEIEESAVVGSELKKNIYIQPRVGTVLHLLYSRKFPEQYEEFFDLMNYGGVSEKETDHPVTKLRKRMKREWVQFGNRTRTQKSNNPDARPQVPHFSQLSSVHVAFRHYIRESKLRNWTSGDRALEELGQIAREVIDIRTTYLPSRLVDIADEDTDFIWNDSEYKTMPANRLPLLVEKVRVAVSDNESHVIAGTTQELSETFGYEDPAQFGRDIEKTRHQLRQFGIDIEKYRTATERSMRIYEKRADFRSKYDH